MAATYVALLRGINVGPSTQVAMADLQRAFDRFDDVQTILRSGNVVFRSATALGPSARIALEDDIATATGVQARVVLLTTAEFLAVVDANPLITVADDDALLVTTFLDGPVPDGIEPPAASVLGPEKMVIAERAVYQWCPLGVSKSKVSPAWWRKLGPLATTRNERTVARIRALL